MKFKNVIYILAICIILALIGVVIFGYYNEFFNKNKNPIATIEVKDYGTIKVELYPEIAPNTVANFIKLSNNGFYDELTFHRIVKDFMIQGGDPLGNGTGSPVFSDIRNDVVKDSDDDKAYSIKGEFAYNGYEKNKLKFEKGVLAMARSSYTSLSSSLTEESYNSAGCQFFITTEDSTNLNGLYCAFGKVIEGMDVVSKIADAEIKVEENEDENSSSTEQSTPVNPPVITSIRVETYGVDYGTPETLEPFDSSAWIKNYYNMNSNSLVTQ